MAGEEATKTAKVEEATKAATVEEAKEPTGVEGKAATTGEAATEEATEVKETKEAEAPATTTTASATTSAILGPEHWAQLQAPAVSETDSLLTSDNSSSTASIASSIFQYRTIHGRTFNSDQGDAQYWGSNDEPQRELMDAAHHVLTLALNDRLYVSPLEKGKVHQAIDIGCGTGIWAIDFADEHPEAEVIGTDISPIQPAWVPPNLKFEIEDCTRPWTYKSNFSDFVHIRWLMGCIRDWDALFAEAYRVCKPGGWLESLEASAAIRSDDGTVAEDSAMGQWGKFFIEGSKKIGTTFTVVEDEIQRKAMQRAGFINIQEHDFKNPIGGWSSDPVERETGPFTLYGLLDDSEGFVLFMAHTLGWTKEEIEVYVAHFRREIRSGKHHGYFPQKVVWGQKPKTAE